MSLFKCQSNRFGQIIQFNSTFYYSANTNHQSTEWHASAAGLDRIVAMSRIQRSIGAIQHWLVSWFTGIADHQQPTHWRPGRWHIRNSGGSCGRCGHLLVHGHLARWQWNSFGSSFGHWIAVCADQHQSRTRRHTNLSRYQYLMDARLRWQQSRQQVHHSTAWGATSR